MSNLKIPGMVRQPQSINYSSVKRIAFELNIKSCRVPSLPDQTCVCVYWVRGGKKIDTKSRFISNGRAQFNERFSMKTVLNYDDNSGEYEPKPVILYIFSNI